MNSDNTETPDGSSMDTGRIEDASRIIEGTLLGDAEIKQLAKEQNNRCKMCENAFDGFWCVEGGELFPLSMHGAQLVYQEPHEHVNIAVCNACFSILTQQGLPLRRADLTPLLFIKARQSA